MINHDPQCPFLKPLYQGACGGECHCNLVERVREDQSKILNSRAVYQSGYADGYAHGYEKALDHAIACFEEDDVYSAIQALRDL